MIHSASATEIGNDRVLGPVMVFTCPVGLVGRELEDNAEDGA